LSATNKEKENNTIELILYNNKYDNSILKKFTAIKKKNTPETKWAKFTYGSKEITFINKLFENTTLKIAFTTQNTIDKLLSKQNNHYQSQFEKCGVYQLTCPDCNKKYIGQTGGPFHMKFQEHFRHYKYGEKIQICATPIR